MGFVPSWNKLAEVELQGIKNMETDPLGNVYVVTGTNQLYKYNPDGKLLSTLNYAYLGNITHLDCSNPLEIYLFYKELNAVVFLDNNLAYRGRLNFNDYGITQALAAARSFDNEVWVFDAGDLQLKKISKSGVLSQQSGNVLQFAGSAYVSPTGIVDNGNRVMVNDSLNGVLVFDVFGNYLKSLAIKGKSEIAVNASEVIYRNELSLVKYHLQTLKRDTLALPNGQWNQVKLVKDRLYVTENNRLSIYTFQP